MNSLKKNPKECSISIFALHIHPTYTRFKSGLIIKHKKIKGSVGIIDGFNKKGKVFINLIQKGRNWKVISCFNCFIKDIKIFKDQGYYKKVYKRWGGS